MGLATIIRRKLFWYRARAHGTFIAWTGNIVRMDGNVFSVDSPYFSSALKSTLALRPS